MSKHQREAIEPGILPRRDSVFFSGNAETSRRLRTIFLIHFAAAVFVLWQASRMASLFAFLGWTAYFVAAWAIAALWKYCPALMLKNGSLGNDCLRTVATLVWASPWALLPFMISDDVLFSRFDLFALLMVLALATSIGVAEHFPSAVASLICLLLPAAILQIARANDSDIRSGAYLVAAFAVLLHMARWLSKKEARSSHLRAEHEHLVDSLDAQLQTQKATIAKLEKALVNAEQACLKKTRFLATASHDLRQPMHAITLFVAALKSEAFEGRPRYLLSRLDRSLAGMDDLFNRLLDIGRLDAGAVTPVLKTIDAFSLAETMETRFAPVATSKSLDFRVRCQAGLYFTSDYVLVTELISNLLSNAFRYTQCGGVLFSIRAKEDHLLIQVTDTGCGIAEHDLSSIFDEFVQLGNPARDRRKGLGLGLAIVRRLANILLHDVTVASRPGRGSRFTLRVARAFDGVKEPMPNPPAGPTRLKGTLVLVVDDEIDILAAMEAVLMSWGCHCITARTPREAARYIDDSPRYPDVIITDHRLADHQTSDDTVAAVAPILPYEVPVIVISGECSPGLERKAQEKGHAFIAKPVNALQLQQAIENALRKVAGAYSEAA